MSNQIRQGRFNVLLTTYEYVIKDRATLAKVQLIATSSMHSLVLLLRGPISISSPTLNEINGSTSCGHIDSSYLNRAFRVYLTSVPRMKPIAPLHVATLTVQRETCPFSQTLSVCHLRVFSSRFAGST